MKKVLSVFLSLVMLLSVTAGLSFTAQAVPQTKDIFLTVTVPKAGEVHDTTATDSNGGTVTRVMWFDLDVSDWQTVGNNVAYIAGHKYRVTAKVKAPTGYIYDVKYGGTRGYVNGAEATVFKFSNDGEDEIEVQYDFGVCPQNRIDAVTLTGAIFSGDTLTANKFGSNDAGIKSVQTTAYRRNGSNIDMGSTATYGSYGVSFILTANAGYAFNINTAITVCGKTAKPFLTSTDNSVAFVNVDGIEIACPHKKLSASWSKDNENHWKVCEMCGEIVESTKAAHKYGAAVPDGQYDVKTCSCGYELFTPNTSLPILYFDLKDSVVACIDGNTIGEIPVKDFRDNSAQLKYHYDSFSVQPTEWYKGSVSPSNKMAAGSKFVAGETYYAVLIIDVTGNYYIDDSPVANGYSEVYAGWIDSYGGTKEKVDNDTVKLTIKYTAIERQKVNIAMPTVTIGKTFKETFDAVVCKTNGTNEGYSALVRGTDGTSYNFNYDGAGNYSTYMSTPIYDILNTKFEPNTDYTIDITKNSAKYTYKSDIDFNGANATESSFNGDSVYVSGSAKYTLGSNVIYEIDIDDVKAPVPGQAPSTEYKVNNKYGVKKGAMVWDTADKFACEKEHTATIVVQAESGYKFAEAPTAAVNGRADVRTTVSGDIATIVIKYPAVSHIYEETARVAATVKAAGSVTYTCALCGEKTEEVLDKLPDVYKLTLKKVTVKKSAKKLVLQATLKKNGKALKKKKITFTFNGKKYTAKTNKKGVAKVTVKKAVLKKLKVGKKIKITAKYGKKTATRKVKVKK